MTSAVARRSQPAGRCASVAPSIAVVTLSDNIDGVAREIAFRRTASITVFVYCRRSCQSVDPNSSPDHAKPGHDTVSGHILTATQNLTVTLIFLAFRFYAAAAQLPLCKRLAPIAPQQLAAVEPLLDVRSADAVHIYAKVFCLNKVSGSHGPVVSSSNMFSL